MGIGKIFADAGKFVLNRGFGVMTKRQGKAAVLKSGRALFEATQRGEQLTSEVVSSIFASKLPKGIKVPSVLSTPEQLKEYCSRNLSEKVAATFNSYADKCGAAYFTIGKNGVFYFPNSTLTSNEAFVVGATHELTHFVDFRGAKISSKFSNLIPKPIKLFFTKLFQKAQSSYMQTQQKLISDLGLTSGLTGNVPAAFSKNMNSSKIISHFRKFIREQIKDLSPREQKLYFKFLNCINASEVSAYTNSGKVGRLFGILGKDRVHASELIGKYQDLFVQALKKEQKSIQIARRAGIKKVRMPKKKFRKSTYLIGDNNGNFHRNVNQYYTTDRQNPTPKCIKTISDNISSQGENLTNMIKVEFSVVTPKIKDTVSNIHARIRAKKRRAATKITIQDIKL